MLLYPLVSCSSSLGLGVPQRLLRLEFLLSPFREWQHTRTQSRHLRTNGTHTGLGQNHSDQSRCSSFTAGLGHPGSSLMFVFSCIHRHSPWFLSFHHEGPLVVIGLDSCPRGPGYISLLSIPVFLFLFYLVGRVILRGFVARSAGVLLRHGGHETWEVLGE